MYAYSGILSALLLRGRTGLGSRVDVSMLESLAEWMGFPMYYAYDGAQPPPRAGASHATIYPYGPFPAGDGGAVMLGLQNEREWATFCDHVLLMPSLKLDERFSANVKRSANRKVLRQIIVDTFADLKAAEIVERLDCAHIASANVNDMAGLWNHPQLKARKRWVQIESPAGLLPAMLPPGINSAFAPRMDPVPALGEHSEAILEELGYTVESIEQMKREAVI
ncbi:Crotonobetainyl-CoA:carnitine CoA-transferase [compost metagenome]